MPAREWIPNDRGRSVVLGVLLFVGTLLLYLPVRNYAFINYDDGLFVCSNPHVSGGLTAESVAWAFTTHDIDYWRPLSWLSHMLDVELFGMNAGGHHLTSAIIHAANAVVLFLLGLAIWSRPLPALMAASAFAFHPVHVESVAWIAERKDVLCGFFWLAALWSHVKAAGPNPAREKGISATGGNSENRPLFRWLTLVFFILGIMSKPMIVTLPFQLVLLDIWPLNRINTSSRQTALKDLWQSVLAKWPLFLLTAGVCVWTYLAQQEAKAMAATTGMNLADRLGNVLVSYARYLGNILWPHDLAVFYPLVPRWPGGAIAGAGALFLTLSGLVTTQLRRRPHWFVGWFWYVGTLVPVIGIIHVGGQSMADRYTYLPAIGLYLLLVQSVFAGASSSHWPRWPAALFGAAILLLGWTAHRQIRTWENGITVFTQAMSATQDNWLAMNNLANNYASAGDWAAAHPLFEKVARLNAGTAESFYNVALARGEVGLASAAEAGYQRALELEPAHFKSLKNLANLLTDVFGRHQEAVDLYRRALAVRPDDPEVRQYLADTLIRLNRGSEAAHEYQTLLQRDPAHESAAISLAQLMLAAGQAEDGLNAITQALALRPESPYLHYHAGVICAAMAKTDEARRHFQFAYERAAGDGELQRAIEARLGALNR